MMLLVSARKCLSVVTHVVQKYVKRVDQLVSVRWDFSLGGITELTEDLKFCYYLTYFFINKFHLAIKTDHDFASITIVQENFFSLF